MITVDDLLKIEKLIDSKVSEPLLQLNNKINTIQKVQNVQSELLHQIMYRLDTEQLPFIELKIDDHEMRLKKHETIV